MVKLLESEHQLGRRLRLRDLSVFFTVVEYGSMAKAGAKLGVSTPSVSEVIAGIEHALGVRLLDRTPKGIVTTPYGNALLARARAAFDELRQGIRDIEFIADPDSGELRIGCPESIAAGFLVPLLARFAEDHPRVRFHVVPVYTPTVEFPELLERKIDLAFARLAGETVPGRFAEELVAEVLFEDPYSVVVGRKSKWARRPRAKLADLVDEPWVMTPLDALGDSFVTKAFTMSGLTAPDLVITTFSIHLRNNLVGSGSFVTALPRSVLRLYRERHSLKELPIELDVSTPVAIVTLRNRTLGPLVRAFIQCARENRELVGEVIALKTRPKQSVYRSRRAKPVEKRLRRSHCPVPQRARPLRVNGRRYCQPVRTAGVPHLADNSSARSPVTSCHKRHGLHCGQPGGFYPRRLFGAGQVTRFLQVYL